ncbi:hypothetical protein PENTCL1PPCAC_3065, partial [Pristionchus entomophagus]
AMADGSTSLVRFSLYATRRTGSTLLRLLGIVFVRHSSPPRFTCSTNRIVRVFMHDPSYYQRTYFFVIDGRLLITANQGVIHYRGGELSIERHNEDGTLPANPCFI